MKYLQLLASACNSCSDDKLSAILKITENLGRSNRESNKKRYTGGEGKYSRWDGYAFTSERYNPEIDMWST